MSPSLLMLNAREVLKKTRELITWLEINELQEPNFSSSSPEYPNDKKYDSICTDLTQAAQDLLLLAQGPKQWVRIFFCTHHDLSAWQVALRFNYFDIVPLDKPMSVKDIAASAEMDQDRVGRIMKMLATQRCFQEIEEGVFEHTALSAFIVREKDIKAAMAFQADEMFEASSLMSASIEKSRHLSEAANSAFNLRFNASPYEWYSANPERAARFASAMAGLVKVNRDTTDLRDRFPWESLGDKLVVDVGGGSGHISIYLAKQFPELNFIVQDINPVMLAQGPQRADFKAVQDRISFMQYDFLQPQPIQSADLFFLRQITHNYPDDVCVKIFKRFAQALEKCGPATILLINDMVMPPANSMPKVEEHHLRQLDIAMLNGYAAKQRTLAEFSHLLKEADDRFEIVKVHGKGIMGLLEVKLKQ